MLVESTGIPFQDYDTGVIRDGVREVPITHLYARQAVELRKIPHPDPELVYKHAQLMARDKLRYDNRYLFDWLFRSGNGDERKITCNEVIEISAAMAGHPVIPKGIVSSPRDIYLISEEI